MWFGVLTPGAHPSRPTATDESTVFCWTAGDRRKIDGPFRAVHGGLRVTRRALHDAGLEPAPPRCFVCLEPVGVRDPDVLRTEAMRLPEGCGPPPLSVTAGAPATLALVHLHPLAGDEDPSPEEEALVVLPQAVFRLVVPLGMLPEALGVVATVAADEPPPACARCGTILPGSAEQRRRVEARLEPRAVRRERARRERRGHGRRAA